MNETSESFGGAIADVTLTPTTAILTAYSNSSSGRDELREKIDSLELLSDLTRGIKGLLIPKVIARNDTVGRYEIERAKGLNLTITQGERQGRSVEFFSIPTSAKVNAVQTYLSMIDRVNRKGYAFKDHKADSVFLQKNGTVTVVDADALNKEINPWIVDRRKPQNLPGLEKLLRNFFYSWTRE